MTPMSSRRATKALRAAQRSRTFSRISALVSSIFARSAKDALDADDRIVTQVANIRGDAAAYVSRYPAAVEVCIHLGAAAWKRLECDRIRAAKFGRLMRRMDREELAMGRDFLDIESYFGKILDYVKEDFGDFAGLVLVSHRHALDSMLAEDAEANVGVQDSLSMTIVRDIFVRKPFMWFVYNLYFPVRGLRGEPGRMNWVQLNNWAIWTLQNPSVEPSFSRVLSGEEFVPVRNVTDADLMYNAALIEVYTDVAARFAEVDGV